MFEFASWENRIMGDEVAKAAERLRRFKSGESALVVWDESSFDDAYAERNGDNETLADAWLAEHHADSELPIDEAWLRSVGGIEPDDLAFGTIDSDDNYSLNVFRDGTISVGFGGCWLDCFIPCKTRGQLRDLCRALQIPLSE